MFVSGFVNEYSEIFNLRAISLAVKSINCVRPIAPATLETSGSKKLSLRISE